MTLTGQLDTAGSPVRVWADQHLPHTRALSAQLRVQVGRDPEAVVPLTAQPYPPGFEPGRQSTAHENRLRASLARPDLTWFAMVAARLGRPHAAPAVEAVALAQQAFDASTPWTRHTPWLLDHESEERLARCAWMLAQLETGWRRGMHDPAGPLMAGHADGQALLAAASPESVRDLVALAGAAADGPFTTYRTTPQDQVTLGPAPKGDRDVGGADADMLVDHTLIEVKTVARLARIARKDLLQLAFYVLLDYDDELRIERVALYLGRQSRLAQWTVPEFLALLTGAPADVPTLRTKLRAALDHQLC